MTNTIIFLSGTSCSGKSSIARRLQKLLAAPFLHVEVDTFLKMVPEEFWKTASQDAQWQFLATLVSGFHRALAALSGAGCNLVVDHVLLEPAWLRECVDVLPADKVLFVGVHCSLDELERRERAREDRGAGSARSQFDRVHAARVYDLEVDTQALSPDGCAAKIIACLENPPSPRAFARMQTSKQRSSAQLREPRA